MIMLTTYIVGALIGGSLITVWVWRLFQPYRLQPAYRAV
jgi:hypothetical protein